MTLSTTNLFFKIKNSSKVYISLPKAGLGNKLLTWSRGFVFAELNNCELCTSSWFSLFVGPWLRREKKKRIYLGYFNKEKLFKRLRFCVYFALYKKIEEPEISKLEENAFSNLYLFNQIFRQHDFFYEVRPYRLIVEQGIYKMLTPSLKEDFKKLEKPVIGIHVRRGDFKFTGHHTPLDFFIRVITALRTQAMRPLSVTVFTDAKPNELSELLSLPNVEVASDKPDILDLLLLSSSNILILSVNSTFSYWAAFLSRGLIIKHPEEWHAPFTNPEENREFFWSKEFEGMHYLKKHLDTSTARC